MFIAGGLLLTVLQTSVLQWWFVGKCFLGHRGILRCNPMNGHWEKLEARLSVYRSSNTSMLNTYKTKAVLCVHVSIVIVRKLEC